MSIIIPDGRKPLLLSLIYIYHTCPIIDWCWRNKARNEKIKIANSALKLRYNLYMIYYRFKKFQIIRHLFLIFKDINSISSQQNALKHLWLGQGHLFETWALFFGLVYVGSCNRPFNLNDRLSNLTGIILSIRNRNSSHMRK